MIRPAVLLVVAFVACCSRLPVQAAGASVHAGKTDDGWAAVERVLPAHPRTLFVGAHPDDETAVAGLLTWLAGRGRLWMVSLTAGENLNTRARARASLSRIYRHSRVIQ